MAFTPTGNKVPTSIGEISISLHDPDGTNANRSIRAHVVVEDQDGETLRTWQGDLQPHLSSGQLTALVNFLTALRQQAVSELL